MQRPHRTAAVDLYWIPLGAGGHCVRFNGRVFEALAAARGAAASLRPLPRRARRRHRRRAVTRSSSRRRRTATWRAGASSRRAPSAAATPGGCVVFRYEVRCWRDGSIPDLGAAVGGPMPADERSPRSPATCSTLVADRPTCRCGGATSYDAGEMWNSNSMIAWLIAGRGAAGGATCDRRPDGRAPGWAAGLEVARSRHGSGPRRRSPRARPPRRPPAPAQRLAEQERRERRPRRPTSSVMTTDVWRAPSRASAANISVNAAAVSRP